jgi:ABC-type transporter lipoprotein component MlaA
MSKVITVVWAAPAAGRWGVKHEGEWVIEPTLGMTVARQKADDYAETLKSRYAIVNVKTEPEKKKRRWG